MVSNYEKNALLFKALAHPVRLQILNILRQGEECVCHIEATLGKRQAYISQQLTILREAGVVESRKEGLQVFYRLIEPTVEDLLTIALGSLSQPGHEVVGGCPCPQCERVGISEHH
jgi:ArsR family transcriptional regulator